jgi:hypothetical protein
LFEEGRAALARYDAERNSNLEGSFGVTPRSNILSEKEPKGEAAMTVPYQVRVGGLLRCCMASLAEAMESAVAPPKEGDTLICRYCGSPYGGMEFRDGAWEWKTKWWRDTIA